MKGVAAVRVRGGLEEEIHVLLEEEALRRTGNTALFAAADGRLLGLLALRDCLRRGQL